MTGEREIERALERLGEHCPVVAIKLGARGAIGYSGGVAISVAADPVDVVDTTGAGDCFDAGFLLGWLGGLGLEESLTLGVIVGTRAVTDYGGYRACPQLSELRALARERGVVLEERVG
jgi:sugar/nucleoside kinase (ribokinase family)